MTRVYSHIAPKMVTCGEKTDIHRQTHGNLLESSLLDSEKEVSREEMGQEVAGSVETKGENKAGQWFRE